MTASPRAGVPAIELIDVHTYLDGKHVLRGVNFGVPRDEITVLLGPSGVGKTTCIRHITGLLFPDSGDVLIEGVSRLQLRKREHNELAHRFGVLLQGSGLFGSALWGSMTVVENLMFQLGALTELPEDELRARAMERLHEVGLSAHADARPAILSAGMAKRVALARALVSDPDFVVLDSFDQGVDPVRLTKLCGVIRWHHETLGGTYLVTTHDMEVARRLADHVVVLYEGRVLEEGPPEQVFGSELAEVRQLVAGDVEGPLDMGTRPADDDPVVEVGAPPSYGEFGMHFPMSLTTLITLVALTVGVLLIWKPNAVEIVLLILVWIAAAAVVALRYERSR